MLKAITERMGHTLGGITGASNPLMLSTYGKKSFKINKIMIYKVIEILHKVTYG